MTTGDKKEIFQGIRSKKAESIVFLVTLFAFQVFMVILFAVWVRYESNADLGPTAADPNPVQTKIDDVYGYFRDINIMIFFGFGFLMTFLRRYGYSALGYTFIISAMVAQWSILVYGFYHTVDHNLSDYASVYKFDIYTMLNGLFCAGAVMISYGAILGRVTPTQMLVMGILEPIFYFLNLFIGEMKLEAVDVGGGMYIHTFGCYYGLTIAWFLTTQKSKESLDNSNSYNGDIFAMAGTLFLWMMWPSFNAAIAPQGDAQFRALANTFISLTSSTMATFIVSRLLGHMGYKLDMVHVQNSSLAGGVVQGVLAHMNISPAIAIVMGFLAGTVSVFGYVFLTPFLTRRFNIQDTCGVNNLHGMPGFIGSVAAIIACARGINNQYLYGSDYDIIFRAGDNQAKNNAAATFITLGIAIVGGIFTGIVLKFVGKIGEIRPEEYYQDSAFWHVASDYPKNYDHTHPVDEEAAKLEHQDVELETKKIGNIDLKNIDLNDLKKKGSSRSDIIRILEALVLSARNDTSHYTNNNNNDSREEEVPDKKDQEIKIPDQNE